MSVFNWIMLWLSGLLGAASLICLVIFLAFDINVWLARSRSLRRGTYMALLLWFNIEVWGRVAYTLIHWNG